MKKLKLIFFLAAVLFGMLMLFFQLEFLPRSIYSMFPVTRKSLHENCKVLSRSQLCLKFSCPSGRYSSAIKELPIEINPSKKYILKAKVKFRNRQEYCPAQRYRNETYLEVSELIPLQG